MSSSIPSNSPSSAIVTAAPKGQKLTSGEIIEQSIKQLPSVQNQMQRNIDQYNKAGTFEWVPLIGGKEKRLEKLEAARSAKETADYFIRKLYDLLLENAGK